MKLEVFVLVCLLAIGYAAKLESGSDLQPAEDVDASKTVLTRKARLIGGGIGIFGGIGIGGFKGIGFGGGPG